MNDQVDSVQWYVSRQIENFFPDPECTSEFSKASILGALNDTEYCLYHNAALTENGLDCTISWQYATFLYFLSRYIWQCENNSRLATKVFLLNKALNGIDLFFEVELPRVFIIGHTVGMVFAKAKYGERLVVHQGCTVGRSGYDRPVLGTGVVMLPNSSIIGNCKIGDNTVVAPGVQVINEDIVGNCYVFAGPGRHVVQKPLSECYSDRYFR